MIGFAKIVVVLTVAVALVVVALPRPKAVAAGLPQGASSPQGAVSRSRPQPAPKDVTLRDGWRSAFAHSDTTGYEFPDEVEEKSTFDLVKEIVLWAAVAGFVAFFIVKDQYE